MENKIHPERPQKAHLHWNRPSLQKSKENTFYQLLIKFHAVFIFKLSFGLI